MMFEQIDKPLSQLRQERPLILNLMNTVAMDIVANGLLSVGASPIMSSAPQELEELVNLASAVVINIGTLTDEFVDLAMQAGKVANALKKPIIFDPVGAGATVYRTSTCQRFLDTFDVAIVRGNASEISALSGGGSSSRGVDTSVSTLDAVDSARRLAADRSMTVVMSGAVDVIVDADRMEQVRRGSEMMSLFTGSGCLLSAVVAAFHAVHTPCFEAACLATYYYAVCGEMAARQATSPGSFRLHFLDALYARPSRGDYANH
jgi:hydroxyethylthiazole kinase